jgi:hypothetical protein
MIQTEDYPPGFAEYTRPMLEARRRALAAMSPDENRVCHYILEAWPELGRGPSFDEVLAGTGLSTEATAACLDRLNKIDMLKYDAKEEQVLVLYPLSSIPCPHRVHIEGQKPVYAM